MWEHLAKAGVPLVQPFGGHAIYLDARRFAPHLAPTGFPGVAMTVELYTVGGVRGVEIGSLMLGYGYRPFRANTDDPAGDPAHPNETADFLRDRIWQQIRKEG